MGVKFWRKPLDGAVLLMVAGAVSPWSVGAQQLFGTVTGKLTDTHSSPLENVSVTLRNVATGAAITAMTSRGGRYSFKDLAGGEYTLAASGSQGDGEVGGIVVSPGHESRVQAVIEFQRSASTSRLPDADLEHQSSAASALQLSNRALLNRLATGAMTEPHDSAVEASLAPEALVGLPVIGSEHWPIHPLPELAAVIPVHLAAGRVPELEAVDLVVLPSSVLAAAHLSTKSEIVAARVEVVQQASEILDSTQLESLPIATRDWTSLLLDAPRSAQNIDDERGLASFGATPDLTVDGMRVRSAFGGVHRGRSGEFAGGESAIREVHFEGAGNLRFAQNGRAFTHIETQRGTEHLHGQMFLFNRQRFLAAQNPFTQWVREMAPGLRSAVPTFAAERYSPSDLELRWGAGAGGVLRRRLFWFGALDGSLRNDPAVATVKHPDRFFAQPSNDQMQLLSAQLGLSSVDPVGEGVRAYSRLLESLSGLLGPAPRSSLQLSGFGRLDWSAADRHRFTVEGSGKFLKAPGGGFTRALQTYGTHSMGSAHSAGEWVLGRWEASITHGLLFVTQGSVGREVHSVEPEKASAFEQSLNINSWGQLPQIVVDSRDGFTIGNPARFSRGRYPDEEVYRAQEQVKWVHGNVLLNAGLELSHENDATNRLRNQTGTYYYSSIGDFASDALAFFAFGMSGQLNPMEQHNCDQRGKPWRDAAGGLHGLGYLPCYSYYSQTMGPSEWWLSTNDWASYVTSQWHPNKRTVFTAAMRWEVEQLPSAISKVDNPDLPLTERLPSLGSQWGPQAGFAWGAGESRWPVLRLGYAMYFGRTLNALVETALTQTGSHNGDLNFFMRPTDNLSGGDAPPFPYVLAGEPANSIKPGAVEFAPSFHNGEVHQAEVSAEETLPWRVHLEASGVASLGRRLPITVDANIDPASNPKTITYMVLDGNGSGPIKTPQITVPFFANWPSLTSSSGFGGRLNPNYQQVSEIFSRANLSYEALLLRVSRNARGLTFRGRYTFGHASDWNPDEGAQPGGPSVLDPTDFRQEYGTSSLDIRHSATAAVILRPKWKLSGFAGHAINGWMLSGVGQFHSGLPYTMRTSGSLPKEFDVNGRAIVGLSTGMNGYGGDNRVYGVGRNTYRYPATWKADLRIAKRFNLGQMRQLELMAESFNLFNHQNVTQVETVGYSIEQGTVNGAMPRLSFLTGLKSGQTEFGKPLDVNATDLYRERQFQFGARMYF